MRGLSGEFSPVSIVSLSHNMFIIDFDDTLFDTQAFKTARVNKLEELGVSEERFWQTYKEAYHDEEGGLFLYNDERHSKALAKRGFDESAVSGAFKFVNSDIKSFLFSDTIDFLEQLKQTGDKLILLSLGDPEFQKMKVYGAGVDKYFDDIYTQNAGKESVIESILNNQKQGGQVWLINDKIEESKRLVLQFPSLKPVLRKSPVFGEDQYKNSAMPYFFNLNQVKEYVQPGI